MTPRKPPTTQLPFNRTTLSQKEHQEENSERQKNTVLIIWVWDKAQIHPDTVMKKTPQDAKIMCYGHP
jgi:hypothetical protein